MVVLDGTFDGFDLSSPGWCKGPINSNASQEIKAREMKLTTQTTTAKALGKEYVE